jgi:hypothetical protein
MNKIQGDYLEINHQPETETVRVSVRTELQILNSITDWIRFGLKIMIFRASQLLMTVISLCESRFTPLADLTLHGIRTQFTHITPRGRNGK